MKFQKELKIKKQLRMSDEISSELNKYASKKFTLISSEKKNPGQCEKFLKNEQLLY
jgi:hypothetical protein